MNSTKFKVEDLSGDVISKDSITTEQINKLKKFFSKKNVNINKIIKITFFKPRRKKISDIEPSASPEYNVQ